MTTPGTGLPNSYRHLVGIVEAPSGKRMWFSKRTLTGVEEVMVTSIPNPNHDEPVTRPQYNIDFEDLNDHCLDVITNGGNYGPCQHRLDRHHIVEEIVPHLMPAGRQLIFREYVAIGDLQYNQNFQMELVNVRVRWAVALLEADGTEVMPNGLPIWQYNRDGEARLRRLEVVLPCETTG
jgi:hypothetical protein